MNNDGCATFAYDGFFRMTTATAITSGRNTAACGAAPSSTTTTYAYDPLDRQQSSAPQSGTTHTFHYDGWKSTVSSDVPSTGSAISYELSPNGQPIGVTQGGTTQLLFDDGHRNVTTTVATTGSVACTARFDPFGNALTAAGTMTPGLVNPSCENTGSTPNTFFYRSARQDPSTGDYQLGSRLYDPNKDSYLTPDAFRTGAPTINPSVGRDPLIGNTYAYVNGDPVNLSDPTGHMFTTGYEGNAAWGSQQPSPGQIPQSPQFQAWNQQIQTTEAQQQQFFAHASAGVQREVATEQAALTAELTMFAEAEYAVNFQLAVELELAQAAAAAQQHRSCDNFLCGLTQGVWGLASGVGTLVNPVGTQLANKVLDSRDNPWLAGDCSGWCFGGQGTVIVASLFAGGVGAVGKAGDAFRVLDVATDGGTHLALGVSTITDESGAVVRSSVLRDFAGQQGAVTWTHPMFSEIIEGQGTWIEKSKAIIDRVASDGGRISFNMEGFNPEQLIGPSGEPSITAAEYQYVMGNPALQNITRFFGG